MAGASGESHATGRGYAVAPPGRTAAESGGRRAVSPGVRVAAAKARVSADKKRGVKTEAWIVDLANKAS